MLRTRTDLWRIALMGSLGWFPNACTDSATESATNSSGQSSTNETDDGASATDTTAATATDGSSNATEATDATATDSIDSDATDGSATDEASAASDPGTPNGPTPTATDVDGTDESAITDGATDSSEPGTATDGNPPLATTDAGGGPNTSVDAGPSKPPVVAATCLDAVPMLVNSLDPDASEMIVTGLETCGDGAVHRPAPVTCPDNLAFRADQTFPDDSGTSTCTKDADCDAAPYGRCMSQGQLPSFECQYGCVSDDDCGADQFCRCGPDIGTCVTAECRSAADCGDGMLCSQWFDYFGIGCDEPPLFACQTPDDACASDADCGDSDSCAVVDGVRECKPIPGVACGRPFIVRGSAILANLATPNDACDEPLPVITNGPNVEHLPPALRARLAEHWAAVGLMEHASIAAFARFCLQLMHVGAPLSLLRDSQAAMLDETLHAELAFSLAGVYANRPIAAGSLPMDGALDAVHLDEILRLVIHEGCVGETVAALEAAEARCYCQDDAVKAALATIREDETRHAQLAWRFVEWAIARSPELARIAADEFRALAPEASEPTAPSALSHGEAQVLRHGVLPESLRAEVRRASLRDVVLPCAENLLRRAERQGSERAA